jgi:8-oxo-dGTP diphosphatase
MSQASVQTAGALLVDAEGRILLGLRSSWKKVAPDRWDAVGGHVEPGESPEMALVRELREELGVTATAFRLIASLPEPRPDLYGEALHHVFAVTGWTGGDPSNACDEHSEIRWFRAEEVGGLSNTTDFDFGRLVELATDRSL